jgi:lactoylglutathione lyase
MVLGIWHFSFTVSDLDAAVAFYVDHLDGQLVLEQDQDNAYTRKLVGYSDARLRIAQVRFEGALGASSHHLELVQYLSPQGDRGDANICNPGAAHLAFAVEDLDEKYTALTAAGIRFVSAPNEITAGVNAGGKAVYFLGPDDIVHELVQPPRRAA